VHEVALVELQVRAAAPPPATGLGFAVSVTVAGGGVAAATVTVAVAALLPPPAPLQINEYAVVAVSAPVDTLPLAAFAPANVPPAPVQAVALVEFHVSTEAPPEVTAVGLAINVAVAGGVVTAATVTVTVAGLLVPPVPLQVNEYVVVAASAPVETLPLIASAPTNVPPVALHAVALSELQVNVVELPPAIEVWAALNDAVGIGAGAGGGLCCAELESCCVAVGSCCVAVGLRVPPQAAIISAIKTGKK
jgi:hypothetical protein